MDLKWVDSKKLQAKEWYDIARIDFMIPSAFDPSWAPTEAEINGRSDMFANLGDADLFQVIYYRAAIVGFHLIHGRKNGIAHISTL